nr:protein FAR1-RELATED SEQUENCE 5-like [Ipomoea batatas]GME01458.1 protein FAR1-RELATED SEQUENCE 5-like [Ipomoea batatas]GME15542.1 protein FAR1-RELATED SEQUENCE 5-like [Ipomoea batatas]
MDETASTMKATNSGTEQSGDGEPECEIEILQDRTKQWLPTAVDDKTPYVGKNFAIVEEIVEFYRALKHPSCKQQRSREETQDQQRKSIGEKEKERKGMRYMWRCGA